MKYGRQNKIIELITNNKVCTQEELTELLRKEGFDVTQATVSRDIRELKLTKVALGKDQQQFYTFIAEGVNLADKYCRVLGDGFISAEEAGNLIVIKTVAGMAMAVAAAVDSLKLEGVLGSIAGDDTVMCATRTPQQAITAANELRLLAKRS